MLQIKNMNIFIKKILYTTASIIFVFLFNANLASASNVYGSAWSEGVGWISFNSCSSPASCNSSSNPSHGVTLDMGTDRVSGTAWNNNIGLISFNPNDWGKCPPNASGCNLASFENNWGSGGWARAVSVVNGASDKENTGGWDGWISLGNNNFYNANIDKNTNINISSPGFSSGNFFTIDSGSNGYWWGSDVVGWIDLNPAGGQPYDANNGGVFVTDLEQDIVLEGNPYVLAGNTTSLTWTAKNTFKPISCERSSNPSVGPTWDQSMYSVSTTTETITDIEVPHDNNTPNTQTEFAIECTDGSVTQRAVWNIIATEFHPELSFPYSCTVKTANPTLYILHTEDAQNPSCNVYADKPTSNRFVGNTNTTSIVDTNFSGVNTNYTMQCTNGITNQAQYSTPNPTLVETCVPFFNVTGNTRCGTTSTNQKYGAVFQKIGLDYVATLELTATPLFGFNTEPIDITSSDSNIVFSPNNFSLNGGSEYNTSTATYTISESDYLSATNNGVDPITVAVALNPSSKASLTLNFCPVDTSVNQVKPIYKPF